MKKMNLWENLDDTVEPAKEKILSYGDYFKGAKYLALSLQSLDNVISEAKLQKKQIKKRTYNDDFPIFSLSISLRVSDRDKNFETIRKQVNINKMQIAMRLKDDSSSRSSSRRSSKRSSRRSPKH